MSFRLRRLAASCTALVLCGAPAVSNAQHTPAWPTPPVTLDGKGVTIYGADSVSQLIFRFRIQELFSATSESESNLRPRETQLMIRRMRLRMEGVVIDPRLRVAFQLSFARQDIDQENTGIAHILRDAVASWQFTKHFAMSTGQGKLPGNRQRVVSSSELQSPDRSPVNAMFTVDRDVGIFSVYSNDVGPARIVARAAISSGEGRGPSAGSDGLAYTGRFDVLPLGAFTSGGDYVEGDLAREPKPKLSVGVAASHNDRATRTGGQLGPRLFAPRSMTTYFADAIYKHRGLAVQAEYAHRVSPDPITQRGDTTRYVFAGEGVTVQASYLLPHVDFEPVLRYSRVTPAGTIRGLDNSEALEERSVGFSNYFNGHRIKFNGDITHIRRTDLTVQRSEAEWRVRLGIEVGI